MLYSSSNSIKYLASGACSVKSYLNRYVVVMTFLVFVTAVTLLGVRFKSREYAIKSNATYNDIMALRNQIQTLELEAATLEVGRHSDMFAAEHNLVQPHDWQISFQTVNNEEQV